MSDATNSPTDPDDIEIVNQLTQLIGDKIKREGRMISVPDIVRETGVSEITIRRWMKGENGDYPVERKLCAYFDCDLGDLLKTVRKRTSDSKTIME